MGDVFKGWRRKIGVVTLVMACVLMAGWARSQRIGECFNVSHAGTRRYDLGSDQNRVFLSLLSAQSGDSIRLRNSNGTEVFVPFYMKMSRGLERRLTECKTEWRCQLWGFEIWKVQTPDIPQFRNLTVMFIPYWSIVLPMTLLSAYLILWKPRSKANGCGCRTLSGQKNNDAPRPQGSRGRGNPAL